MQITKGKIELRPIGKSGKPICQGERDFIYPKDVHILELGFDELLEMCFVNGTEYVDARKFVKSIQVVVTADPVPVRELFADGTVKCDNRISYEELYKQSIEELKVLSEELERLKTAINEGEYQ